MVTSVEGIYRSGRIELLECPVQPDGSRVIVTWVDERGVVGTAGSASEIEPAIDLRSRGIDEGHAADLRRRLKAFAPDWDLPEMAAYDELPPR